MSVVEHAYQNTTAASSGVRSEKFYIGILSYQPQIEKK
jgi:hypothetical protein